jgi:hypothetical protein
MRTSLLVAFLVALLNSASAQVSSLLPIHPRLQWPNANGYCGETSIQMCGLYYGNYISQDLCRTVAGGEVLIDVNDTLALKAFSFNFSEWDPSVATPEYQNYLNWVKFFLNKKQPVIITVYIQGLSDPDYDHIIPAVGFTATNVNTYTGTDQLTYNSCFDTTSFTRQFSTLYDTRSMTGNGATYDYCIPKNVDYGVAVTGNKDPARLSRPVHIVLDSVDEPNVSLGVPARRIKAWVTADSLTPGTTYHLLRYNNYQTVPSTGFSTSNASSFVNFTATGINFTVKDSFMSNTAVFYRCISYLATGIADTEPMHSSDFFIYPNPSAGSCTIHLPADAEKITLTNIVGQLIQETAVTNQTEVQLQLANPGIYFVRLLASGKMQTRKLIFR